MKLTKSKLKQLVKEELNKTLMAEEEYDQSHKIYRSRADSKEGFHIDAVAKNVSALYGMLQDMSGRIAAIEKQLGMPEHDPLVKEELNNMLDERRPGRIEVLTARIESLARGLRAAFDQIDRVEAAIKPSAWQG